MTPLGAGRNSNRRAGFLGWYLGRIPAAACPVHRVAVAVGIAGRPAGNVTRRYRGRSVCLGLEPVQLTPLRGTWTAHQKVGAACSIHGCPSKPIRSRGEHKTPVLESDPIERTKVRCRVEVGHLRAV